MGRFVRTLTIFLAALGSVLAQPDLLMSVFFPPEDRVRQACDEGYKAGETGDPTDMVRGLRYMFSFSPGGVTPLERIQLNTPLSQAFLSCWNDARHLQPKRYPSVQTVHGYVIIELRGEVNKLEQAKNWAVALSLRLGSTELVRVFPIYKSVGEIRDWQIDCSIPGCVWRGKNYYGFYLKPHEEVIRKADGLAILYNVGSGIQEIVVPPDLLNKVR